MERSGGDSPASSPAKAEKGALNNLEANTVKISVEFNQFFLVPRLSLGTHLTNLFSVQ